MSTQLDDLGAMWRVSTVTAPGKRKKMARKSVLIPKGDKDALRLEIIRQAEQARRDFGVALILAEAVE